MYRKKVELVYGEATEVILDKCRIVEDYRIQIECGVNMIGKKIHIKAYSLNGHIWGSENVELTDKIITVDTDVQYADLRWEMFKITFEPLQEDNWPISVTLKLMN